MGEKMGIPTRNAVELDEVVKGLEDALSSLAERVATLEAYASPRPGLTPIDNTE